MIQIKDRPEEASWLEAHQFPAGPSRLPCRRTTEEPMPKMMAAVFAEPGRIVLESRPVPDVGPLDALLRISTTTICGTDVHILRGEYPVAKGLIVGHEPVGIIEKLGSEVKGYKEGQRVIAGAITPSGHSYACLCGMASGLRAAGVSATRSTAARPSSCSCRMR
jgi:Zn-dependent alcohol dehydrogenase